MAVFPSPDQDQHLVMDNDTACKHIEAARWLARQSSRWSFIHPRPTLPDVPIE